MAVLDLARTTIALVAKRGEPAYLTQIDIQLRGVNASRPLIGVDYTFYYPKTRKRLSVTNVNTDVSMSPEQMKMAQQAGVADATLTALAFCAQVFMAIDARSHSVSDSLYGVYPFIVSTFLLLDWVASRTTDGRRDTDGKACPTLSLTNRQCGLNEE